MSYVFSCDSDKNSEVSASLEEAAEMDVMLANERGISVVFSPTKQSFFNTIVGDQRTREGGCSKDSEANLKKQMFAVSKSRYNA